MTDTSPPDRLTREETLLLKNLLARLDADAGGDRPQFRGVVSDAEREALRALLGGTGAAPPSPPIPSVEPVAEVPEPPEPAESSEAEEPPEERVTDELSPVVELNLDALGSDVSPPPEWVLCLDFGTAKSKAFAATDDEGIRNSNRWL